MSVANPQMQAVNAQQQARPAHPVPSQQSQQQQQQHPIDPDTKKLNDMLDALNLIGVMRENINIIIDNVGKTNSANNYSRILANKSNKSADNLDPKQTQQQGQLNPQQQGGSNENEPSSVDDSSERLYNLDQEQQEFFEKTDNKYLHDRVIDINKSIV
jgi:hypothetical protein